MKRSLVSISAFVSIAVLSCTLERSGTASDLNSEATGGAASNGGATTIPLVQGGELNSIGSSGSSSGGNSISSGGYSAGAAGLSSDGGVSYGGQNLGGNSRGGQNSAGQSGADAGGISGSGGAYTCAPDPENKERCEDGLDNDCDGWIDETFCFPPL